MTEPTLEQRIAMAKAVYEQNPTYKGKLPEAVMAPVDIAKLDLSTLSPQQEGKAVASLVTQATSQRELRMLRSRVEKQLKRKDNTRIPKEVNAAVLKELPNVIKSTVETGKNRAEFLLECIEFEKSQLQEKKTKREEKKKLTTIPGDTLEAMASIMNDDMLFAERDEDEFFWSETALSVLKGWIGVCEKAEVKQLYEMCMVLFASRLISSETKLDIASAFYISNYVEYWGDLYYTILQCPFTRVEDRLECCKLLYHSGDEKYLPLIETTLSDVVTSDLDDDTRYQTIANYVTNTGIATKFLSNVLQIEEINQSLLAALFLKFINTKADYYYIVMSCEFLLEQTANKDIYEEVCKKLLTIANETTLDDRTRADAADVLLRNNIEPYCTEAQAIIQAIGESGQTEIEKTVYSNKENVHKLSDVFEKYIMAMYKKYIGKMPKLDDVTNAIEDLSDNLNLDDDTVFKIRQSIDRIMLEPTLHTVHKISTSNIFRVVWTVIHTEFTGEHLVSLQHRFLEELEDMSNTCSSGHAKRLVNVMVGFTDALEGAVDIVDQFVANIKARLMATIKNMKDEDVKDALMESMTERGAGKRAFNEHILSVAETVRSELFNEFVTEGWLSDKKFSSIFTATVDKIVQ